MHCPGLNGISQYLIQGTKMGSRVCAGGYGLRECLPGQRGAGGGGRGGGWGGCRAVSYVRCTWTHIFEDKLTVGHARQHSEHFLRSCL